MNIDLDKIDENTKIYLFGDVLGLPYEQTTPEWNIQYYSMLIKYTNKTLLKKKHTDNLNWWIATKNKRD